MKDVSVNRFKATVLYVVLFLVCVPPGYAQQLEEVVVTAQKREESLQDVPLSVSAFSGEMLANMNYAQIDQVSELVPNFNMGESPGEYTINIRGIGSATSNRAFEQSVGLYVDGVYTGRSQQFQAPFLDMQQIEIVRGPQGVLFGKNSSAGAVSITSNKPDQEFYSSVRGVYEFEYGGWDLEGVLNGGVTDTLSARLAVKKQVDAAYMDNSAGSDGAETDLEAIRGSLMWNPNDDLQIYFKIDYADVSWEGTNFQVLAFSPAARGFYLSKDPNAEDVFDLRQQLNGDFLAGGGIENWVESTAYVLQADYSLGENVLTYIGAYSEYESQLGIDTDFGGFSGTFSGGLDEFEQFSHELRLTSPAGEKFSYIAGLYYLDRNYKIPDWQFDANFPELPPPFPPFTRYRNYDEDSDLWSAFFQGTWALNDQWSLTRVCAMSTRTRKLTVCKCAPRSATSPSRHPREFRRRCFPTLLSVASVAKAHGARPSICSTRPPTA
jgi:outer membrane receptor protein involved in Fe transport